MKTRDSKGLTTSQQKFAKRWMVGVSAFYGLAVLGMLAVIVTGNAAPDDSKDAPQQLVINGLDDFAADAGVTDGLGHAQAPMPSAPVARLAPVPVPEVDEMIPDQLFPSSRADAAPAAAHGSEALAENAWDFTNPDSIPGFGSLPQPGDTPSSDERRRTAQTNR